MFNFVRVQIRHFDRYGITKEINADNNITVFIEYRFFCFFQNDLYGILKNFPVSLSALLLHIRKTGPAEPIQWPVMTRVSSRLCSILCRLEKFPDPVSAGSRFLQAFLPMCEGYSLSYPILHPFLTLFYVPNTKSIRGGCS